MMHQTTRASGSETRVPRPVSRLAFTLIELLTVIAITAVLMTIIVVPIYQSFNLTRTAQAFADAQDKARIVSESIAREIGSSVGVRDLSGFSGFAVNGVNVPRHTLAVTVPKVNPDGTAIATGAPFAQALLPFAKVDIFQPAEGEEFLETGGAVINPVTGMRDPTLKAPKGAIRLPAAPGKLWVRYFVGLREPVRFENGQYVAMSYNDPYTGLLGARNASRDNLFVLWRVEYIPRAAAGWNLNLFDVQNGVPTDLDDPSFFSFIPGIDTASDTDMTLNTRGIAKAKRILHWLGRTDTNGPGTGPGFGHATLVTEVSRYDMIQPLYDKRSRLVQNENGIPKLVSCVQFRPTRISNDPAIPATTLRLGEETLNASQLAADMYTTKFALWSNAYVRVWPKGFMPDNPNLNQYVIGKPFFDTATNTNRFGVFAVDRDAAANTESATTTKLFDQTIYESTSSYPFTAAVNAANLADPNLRDLFFPFYTSPALGRVIVSFNIDEVGSTANNAGVPNLPQIGAGEELTPFNEVAATAPYSPYAGGTSFNVAGFGVNQVFNRVYNELAPQPAEGGRPALPYELHRFIDLRVVPCLDGTPSPLFPNYVGGTTGFTRANGLGTRNSRAVIVPGSEEIWGPDQLSESNKGQPIRYTRVTTNPGPNQYKINYTDLMEPGQADNGAIDYTIAYPQVQAVPPIDYTPDNFVSAVLQPRYRVGYVQLYSEPTAPLPTGIFRISYKFQFMSGPTVTVTGGRRITQPGDRLAVDYDTRQLMSVLLTIRNYPQSSVPNPQAITLQATATVRNYVR